MHVCLCAREYVPDADIGGIGAYTRHLAKGLRGLNHEVIILSDRMAGAAPGPDLDGERGSIRSWLRPFRWSPRHAASAVLYGAELSQRVRRLQAERGIDVLEAPEWQGEAFWLPRAVPRVVRLHTPHFVVARFDKLPASASGFIVEYLERRSIEQATLLTCPSLSLARLVAQHYALPIERIRVVRNPVDTELFHPGDTTPGDSPVILFAGRLNERKGPWVLARAIPQIIKACADVTFCFAGPDATDPVTGRSNRAALQAFLADRCVGDKVRFLPRQDRGAMASLYRASAVCVVPSLYDNLPYTCLEAMASGKPVVGTAAGGIAEVLSHESNGLVVPPGEPEALAQAVIRLLGNRRLGQELGRNARATAIAQYSIGSIAAQTVEAYRTARSLAQQRSHA